MVSKLPNPSSGAVRRAKQEMKLQGTFSYTLTPESATLMVKTGTMRQVLRTRIEECARTGEATVFLTRNADIWEYVNEQFQRIKQSLAFARVNGKYDIDCGLVRMYTVFNNLMIYRSDRYQALLEKESNRAL